MILLAVLVQTTSTNVGLALAGGGRIVFSSMVL